MSGNEKQKRRAAAAREVEARKKAESDRADWTARANVIAAADPLVAVRDAAGELVRSGVSAEEAALALRERFPALPMAVLTETSHHAYALLEAAWEAVQQVREHQLSENEALERFLAGWPGFSAAAYERFLGAGWFGTR